MIGADVVVSIGNLLDAEQADLAINVNMPPREVVSELARMIRVKLG
jgi:hypothetical protein